MAKWRSRELEGLFGGPLDAAGLTEATFDQLRVDGVVEGDQLDFKRVVPGEVPYPPTAKGPRAAWTNEQEFAKDVAAFANHRGGIIVIGLGDAAGVAHKLTPVTVSTPEKEQQRLGHALRNYQAPLAECEYVPVVSSAGWYMAVVVPPSPRSPHAVLGDPSDSRRPLQYPVRHDRDTWWLSEHDVADRYRRRITAQEELENHVSRVVLEGGESLRHSQGVWLYAAIVPEFPAGEERLDNATVKRIDEWQHGFSLSSPRQRALRAFGRGIPAPGKVTFTGSRRWEQDDATSISDGYLELHVDGAAYAATPIDPFPQKESGRQVGDITLVEDMILLVDVAVRWCVEQSGTFGTATLVAGFTDADTADGSIGMALTLVYEDPQRASRARLAGIRKVTGRPSTSLVVDLSTVETLQQRLNATHLILCGLLPWFGLAEPAQLTSGGTIVAREFGMSSYRMVESWAGDHEVAAELLKEA